MAVVTTPGHVARTTAADLEKRANADLAGAVFKWTLIGATTFATAFLAVLIIVMVVDGWSVLSGNLSAFLSQGFSQRSAADAGVWHGILGSFQIALVTAGFAVPIGVATAVYLVEYSQGSRFARIVELNIRNLAGVPSIVYGLLGLTVFVNLIAAVGIGVFLAALAFVRQVAQQQLEMLQGIPDRVEVVRRLEVDAVHTRGASIRSGGHLSRGVEAGGGRAL